MWERELEKLKAREREREFVQREEEYRRRNGVLNFKSVSHFLALEEK